MVPVLPPSTRRLAPLTSYALAILEGSTDNQVSYYPRGWSRLVFLREIGTRLITTESRMSFDLQPTLKGELLELRPLRPDDFHALYAAASDPLIWEQHPIKDRYKEEVFKVFFREALESGGALIAIDSKAGRVIGSSRFHGHDEEKSAIEIGWTFLVRSHWGGIFNREMKQLMLRHAFRFVDSVIFLVGPQNLRSQRAVEKIGGVRVGSRPDGGGRDSFVYQITARTFAQDGAAEPAH
jgi:RimJ/RimL family protein N-acetyltransferase